MEDQAAEKSPPSTGNATVEESSTNVEGFKSTGKPEAVKPASEAPVEQTKAFTIDEANEEIARLLETGKINQMEVQALQGLMRDHAALKTKVDRLKALLGRSAKAQRESKIDLEATQKKLEQALREIERLSKKVDHLTTRPTHMELLADFETNFDRALLSVGQTGGQETAPTAHSTPIVQYQESAVDSMLMEELAESKARVEKLESLNAALVQRSSQLESDARERRKERDVATQKLTNMELELRMARMEADHATRSMQEKAASLKEMQMEIDLVTKASIKANVRAAQGEEMAKSVKTDRKTVQELEAQVHAFKEWALAAAESKRLTMERVDLLEKQLRQYQGRAQEEDSSPEGRLLLFRSSALLVGAGDRGFIVIELGEKVKEVRFGEHLVVKWKFDVTPNDFTTSFSLAKGTITAKPQLRGADYVIKDRVVTAGAAGETEQVFVGCASCTLVWGNEKSWIRPISIKYSVEVIALSD